MKRRERKALERVRPVLMMHALEAAPQETCGLLSWTGRDLNVYGCRNASTEPETSFLVDPEDQRTVLRLIADLGEELWALFHSHSHEGATPSERDRKFALAEPSLRWVIVGLEPEEVWVGYPGNDDGADISVDPV